MIYNKMMAIALLEKVYELLIVKICASLEKLAIWASAEYF